MQRWFQQDGFLMRAFGTLASLALINVLWLFSSLPVFTIGAAFSAQYDCVCRLNRGESAGVRVFFQSFRENFRQSTPIWLIVLLIVGILIGDFQITLASNWPFRSVLLVGITAVAIIAAIPLPFLFLPSQAGDTGSIIRRSYLLGIRHLPRTFAVLLLWSIPIVWLFFFPFSFWRFAWIWLGFGFALIVYLSEKLLKKCN